MASQPESVDHSETQFNRTVFSADEAVYLAFKSMLMDSGRPQSVSVAVPAQELIQETQSEPIAPIDSPRRQLRGFTRIQPPADEYRDRLVEHFDPTADKIKAILRIKMTEMNEAARDPKAPFTPTEIAQRARLDPGLVQTDFDFLDDYAKYLRTSKRVTKPRHKVGL